MLTLAVLMITMAVVPASAHAGHACQGTDLLEPAGALVDRYSAILGPVSYEIDLEEGETLTAALGMVLINEPTTPGTVVPTFPQNLEEAPDQLPTPQQLRDALVDSAQHNLPKPVLQAHLEVHHSQGCHNFYDHGRAVQFTAPSDGTYILQVHGQLDAHYAMAWAATST